MNDCKAQNKQLKLNLCARISCETFNIGVHKTSNAVFVLGVLTFFFFFLGWGWGVGRWMEVCVVSHLSLGTCVGVWAAPVLRSLTSTTAVPLLRETSQQVYMGQQLNLLCENRLVLSHKHTCTPCAQHCARTSKYTMCIEPKRANTCMWVAIDIPGYKYLLTSLPWIFGSANLNLSGNTT